VVVGDLGSLQFIKSKGLHTEYIATRWYRSPECLLTEGYYSFELDIWAAGCVFYETLTRNPLFPGI
jgi:Serine/threonine protein kinase